MSLHLISCLLALGSGIAVFIAGVFAQSQIIQLAYSAPVLFLIDVGLFSLATYQGLWIHDYLRARQPRARDQR